MMDLKMMHTSKLIHVWHPMDNMRKPITGSGQCSEYKCCDKMIQKIMHCPHIWMEKIQRKALKGFKQAALKMRIPHHVAEAYIWTMTK